MFGGIKLPAAAKNESLALRPQIACPFVGVYLVMRKPVRDH